MAYYTDVSNGESWLGATMHEDSDCETIDGTPRPVGETSVDNRSEEVEWCDECVPFGDGSASGGTTGDGDDADETPTGTCDVVKSDGEVCGRDRPCAYHD